MEHEKREQEHAVLSNGKRQRDQELVVHDSIALPDGPPVDFRIRLAEPLGDAMMAVGGGAPNQARRLKVARVLPGAFKAQVMMDLSKIESCPMLLPSYFPRPTPIQSEAISNDDMQLNVFDVVNFVLRQLPDEYFRQYAILPNPLKHDSKAATERLSRIWHYNGANGSKWERSDNMLLRAWNDDGAYDPKPESLLDFVGKEYGVFTKGFDEEKVASGELTLGHDWDTLGAEAKHAVGELAQHLVDDGLTTGILYTRKVLWEVELGNTDPDDLVVCIGEPVTASDTKPSMAEVVFALVHKRLVSERQRKEDEEEDAARVSSAREGPQSGGFENGVIASGFEDDLGSNDWTSSVSGVWASGDETKGDELLREFVDTEPAVHGNSLVRIGRINGAKVAAKLVVADKDAWVKREIENESRCLEALKSLQGSVIPEKLFAGRFNEGEDRLLVTKFVEGSRFDEAQVTEEVAAAARNALQEIHKKGYIHGDARACNIVVQNGGKCVFLDLGRARQIKYAREKRTEMSELEAAIRNGFRNSFRNGTNSDSV